MKRTCRFCKRTIHPVDASERKRHPDREYCPWCGQVFESDAVRCKMCGKFTSTHTSWHVGDKPFYACGENCARRLMKQLEHATRKVA